MTEKKLGFGMMRLPLLDKDVRDSIDYEQLDRMVDYFLDRGFTYFDTAWMYHNHSSEKAVARSIISRYPRDRYTITTKLPDYMIKTEQDRDRIFQKQLEKTQAGYFDYYLLHDVNSKSVGTFRDMKCYEWGLKKKEEGLIGSFGFSFHDGPELLDEFLNECPEMEFVQLQINYLDWNSPGIRSRECYEVAQKHGKKVIVMEPVKGGALASVPAEVERMLKEADPTMSIASWAIRFAASLPNVMKVLSGMSSMEQMIDNAGYMQNFVPLTEQEKKMLIKAGEIISRDVSIPCTGCAYCTVKCPQNIPIPSYFNLYNLDIKERKMHGDWTSQDGYYETLKKKGPSPSDCIRCGECEKICPQQLQIREDLKRVARHFEE